MHCIWTLPNGDNDFSIRWNLIKSRFSKSVKSNFHRTDWMNESKQKHRETTVWQRRFWEHQIRDEADYHKNEDYIHYNPVKHAIIMSKKVFIRPIGTVKCFVFLTKNLVNHGVVGNSSTSSPTSGRRETYPNQSIVPPAYPPYIVLKIIRKGKKGAKLKLFCRPQTS